MLNTNYVSCLIKFKHKKLCLLLLSYKLLWIFFLNIFLVCSMRSLLCCLGACAIDVGVFGWMQFSFKIWISHQIHAYGMKLEWILGFGKHQPNRHRRWKTMQKPYQNKAKPKRLNSYANELKQHRNKKELNKILCNSQSINRLFANLMFCIYIGFMTFNMHAIYRDLYIINVLCEWRNKPNLNSLVLDGGA